MKIATKKSLCSLALIVVSSSMFSAATQAADRNDVAIGLLTGVVAGYVLSEHSSDLRVHYRYSDHYHRHHNHQHHHRHKKRHCHHKQHRHWVHRGDEFHHGHHSGWKREKPHNNHRYDKRERRGHANKGYDNVYASRDRH